MLQVPWHVLRLRHLDNGLCKHGSSEYRAITAWMNLRSAFWSVVDGVHQLIVAATSTCSRLEDLMAAEQTFSDDLVEQIPFLRRYVRRLTSADDMTDDIVQQTILKALLHARDFRQESSLRSWVASIAVNEVRQVWRSKWRTSVLPLEIDNGRATACVLEFPQENLDARQRKALVRGAVSRLSDRDRTVVQLCDLERLPAVEAARRLGITPNAVKGRRHRARQRLRQLLRGL